MSDKDDAPKSVWINPKDVYWSRGKYDDKDRVEYNLKSLTNTQAITIYRKAKHDDHKYISISKLVDVVCLDDNFTVEELEAIIIVMKEGLE